jgi:preprotein translocase subunit SecE
METPTTKKSVIKTIAIVAVSVAIGFAIYNGAEYGIKKMLKKA